MPRSRYAKLTGKPAVFMVTSGPGVTNAVTPIADAYYDNVPLVVLTGQVGTGDMRGDLPVKQRGFQEVDTIDLMKPITKAAFLVKDVRELPDLHGAGLLPRAHGPPGAGRRRSADERAARDAAEQRRIPGYRAQRCRAALLTRPRKSRPWRRWIAQRRTPGHPGRRRRDRLRRDARNSRLGRARAAFPWR